MCVSLSLSLSLFFFSKFRNFGLIEITNCVLCLYSLSLSIFTLNQKSEANALSEIGGICSVRVCFAEPCIFSLSSSLSSLFSSLSPLRILSVAHTQNFPQIKTFLVSSRSLLPLSLFVSLKILRCQDCVYQSHITKKRRKEKKTQ